MNGFGDLPSDQLRVFLHLYLHWDRYWSGVEVFELASHTGIDEQNLKPLLEALSATGHIKFGHDTVNLKESVHKELKKARQAHAMSSLRQGSLTLLLPPRAAMERLAERIEQGRKIAGADLMAVDAETYPEDVTKWFRETGELLATAFKEAWPRDGLEAMIGASSVKGWARIGEMRSAKDAVGIAVAWLQEIVDRVARENGPQKSEGGTAMEATTTPGTKVFIVHGHDKLARESVARAVQRLGPDYVILEEETEGGRTLIEKLAHHGSQVQYAIAILTPDDLGASKAELIPDCKAGAVPVSKLKPRPRQNVVLELGYFVGKLGRGQVCVMYKSDLKALVDELSDWRGVACVEMDENDAWKHKLGKELIAAGIKVDLNKV